MDIFLLSEFFIECFSGEHISSNIYILKSQDFTFQHVNLTKARGCEKAAKKDIRILCYKS